MFRFLNQPASILYFAATFLSMNDCYDCDTGYNIMSGFDDEEYDFYIVSLLDEWSANNLDKKLGAAAKGDE